MTTRIRSLFVLGALLVACSKPSSEPSAAVPAVDAASGAPSASASAAPATSANAARTATPRADVKLGERDVTVELVAAKTDIIAGEPLVLLHRVVNRSSSEIWLVQGGDYQNKYGRPDSYKVSATSESGTPLPVKPAGPAFGGMTGPVRIAPGKAHDTRLLLPAWLDLKDEGRYLVSVDKELTLGAGSIDGWSKPGVGTVVPSHLSLAVHVSPATPESMGAVIDGLGATMAGSDPQAAQQAAALLAFVRDERAVPHFAKAALRDENWSLVFASLRALGDFKSPAALAALVAVLGKGGPTTLTAAQSIATQSTPEGMNVLWGLRKNADESVRLTVVHALDQQSPPDVVAKLTEMSHDKSAMVNGEAKRYLSERSSVSPSRNAH